MKNKIKRLFLCLVMFSGIMNVSAARDEWYFPGIGEMEVPEFISVEEGRQEALPFMKDGGIRLYFTRQGATDGHYYTLSYTNPPDFSYGWATSQRLGSPYLLEIGKSSYRNKPVYVQMDLIAEYLNTQLSAKGAVFEGDLPLLRHERGKNHYWEGKFILDRRERNITYHTNYIVILENDGYFITLGIISSDGEQKKFTDALYDMVKNRKDRKDKRVLQIKDKTEKQK